MSSTHELQAPSFHARRLEYVDTLDPERRYTEGRCGEFAAALAGLTGWPIFVVVTINYAGVVTTTPGLHAVVQRPDGQYVDVTGTMTEKELLLAWDGWRSPDEQMAIIPWSEDGWRWLLNPYVIEVAKDYIRDERPELIR